MSKRALYLSFLAAAVFALEVIAKVSTVAAAVYVLVLMMWVFGPVPGIVLSMISAFAISFGSVWYREYKKRTWL